MEAMESELKMHEGSNTFDQDWECIINSIILQSTECIGKVKKMS